MKKIYHIAPLYESFVWGGRRLIERYRLDTELENVGMIYHVIAIPGKLDCTVKETGEPLSEFYKNNRELFGCDSDLFPVRMATSCGEYKMSYHLHPGDAYAMAHEGTRGKVSGSVSMEESEEVSEKLFGNKAKSLEEFKRLVETEDWENLFTTVKVKEGDFLNTPAGVIHGGGGGGKMMMTFSTNSDITYRFYDYGRNDPARRLHLEQVYDCVNIPEVPFGPVHAVPEEVDGVRIYHYYCKAGEYTAKRIDVDGSGRYRQEEFYFLFCAEGSGTVGGEPLPEGQTIFVPAGYGDLELDGAMKLYLISYEDEDRK